MSAPKRFIVEVNNSVVFETDDLGEARFQKLQTERKFRGDTTKKISIFDNRDDKWVL